MSAGHGVYRAICVFKSNSCLYENKSVNDVQKVAVMHLKLFANRYTRIEEAAAAGCGGIEL